MTNRRESRAAGRPAGLTGAAGAAVGVGAALRRLAAALVVLLAVPLAVLLAPPPAASAGAPAPAALNPAEVDRFMADYLDQTGLPGAVVAITRGTEVVHVAGYGHDSSGAALSATTRVPIASVSKSMTALAVLQLVEAHRVDLDAPVRTYLDDFRLADPRGDAITVRQLLNQTSGMADSAFPDLRRAQPDSLASAVTRLHEAELASAPGTEYHYHNPNYEVAARLVEVAGGQPFGDYLREHVFTPLGMTDSTTVNSAPDAADTTHGYVRIYGLPVAVPEVDWFTNGSHGVLTTARDLAQWLITQNNGGQSASGRRVVSAEGVELMHTPSGVSDHYGMGWERSRPEQQPARISHTGQWFSYTAQQTLLPDSGYGIAVVATTGLSVEDDPAVITEGLVALTQGQTPQVRRPSGVQADWVLAALTLAAAGLGVLGVARSRRWAQRRAHAARWWVVVRLVPVALPAVCLVFLPELVGAVFANRAGTFLHVLYVWPALVVWVAVGALAGLAVLVARGARVLRAQ
ncbi:serine hydrolase domain-containing protein [Goodfellowiella coeruleoviolacea]|uniref:CubicO group peptidase, beta-lactamase class C family n=1 Tax=Goodfellowiella coeruleoviolacea TaxID=334858 RepID=A0AAE3GC54_9PSEU|nr:serine hydrolase domain-containing protein [Goodfellowiella coeruleoviolacea]MCP2165581.1 CubicO group peptidase, beta-lactamase class C family [Goodfellowiella coeruleoviolacea]